MAIFTRYINLEKKNFFFFFEQGCRTILVREKDRFIKKVIKK